MVSEGGYKNMRHIARVRVNEVSSSIKLTLYVITLLNTDCRSLMCSSLWMRLYSHFSCPSSKKNEMLAKLVE